MNALVIYDSAYGNTAQIARAIGDALGSPAEVATLQAGEVTPDHLTGLSLLIVGSPTQRFSSTPATKNFLDRIPEHALKGVRVAAFDTRFTREHMKSVSSVLSFSAGLVGDSAYAAKSIAAGLKKKAASWSLRPKDSTLKHGGALAARRAGARRRLGQAYQRNPVCLTSTLGYPSNHVASWQFWNLARQRVDLLFAPRMQKQVPYRCPNDYLLVRLKPNFRGGEVILVSCCDSIVEMHGLSFVFSHLSTLTFTRMEVSTGIPVSA